MELYLNSNKNEDCHLRKHIFNLKSERSDGLLLQVHHSYPDSVGDIKKFKFIHASFNDWGTHLAVADHKGHVFIVNLEDKRYWQIPQFGPPTLLSFPPLQKEEVLMGLEDTTIVSIHMETGDVIGVLVGHSVPATEISYSDNGKYYLTSCTAEAIVWESSTHVQIHKLSLKLDVCLKKVLFMPVTNHILACFQDDTMHVWEFGSFESIKQIVPETWKTHHLKAIAFTKNGRAMVIGGHAPNIVIFCLDTWVVKTVIRFPDQISGIKQMEFVSQVFDGGANKVLVLLTTSLEIYFFDIEMLIFLKDLQPVFGLTVKFSLSLNGKYIATLLTTGEVNVYLVEKLILRKNSTANSEIGPFNQSLTNRNYSSSSKRTQKSYESLSSIQRQLKEVLNVKKLIPILKQFGEYPENYRILIWKTILQLPENQESFVSLSMKKCHPSFNKLEFKYPLVNKSLCNSLKKLLSNLSHWCPLFGEVEFLPEFVFPFVKLFHSNPLDCFEVVATIIVNWCQNWFEFYPFPPINLLSLLESILGHHDPELLEFYIKNDITSSISVCPLFHTVFSEVLTKTEWLKIWDHILSNEPSFLFMAIIAYNVVCRNAIRSLQDSTEVENFFHTQNPVDMKMLISKTYFYLRETPDEIHIRQFFYPFRALSSGGTYSSFAAYPKFIVDSSAEKLQSIRKEEETILEEQFKALDIKKKLDAKLKDTQMEDQEKIYQEVEDKIRKTVEEEEDRILTERRKLQNLRQELKLKELEILESTRDKTLKEKIRRKEMEFQRLLNDISKRKAREKMEVDVLEREIRNYISDLLLQKCQLELELDLPEIEDNLGENLEAQRQKLKNDMTEFQNEWDSPHHSKRINIHNKIAAVKRLMHTVEIELAKEVAEKSSDKELQSNRAFIEQLGQKVRTLEDEIEQLLLSNLNKIRERKHQTSNINSLTKDKFTHRRSCDKVNDHCNMTHESGITNIATPKIQGAVKCVTRKISPGIQTNVRKITTIRTRLPKQKLMPTNDQKHYKKSAPEECSNGVDEEPEVTLASPKDHPTVHRRSKFTCPTEHSFKPDFKSSDSELSCRSFQHQPIGDSIFKRKVKRNHETTEHQKRGNISKFITKKEPWLMKSDSRDEIVKSALNARKEIIEEAKRKLGFQ